MKPDRERPHSLDWAAHAGAQDDVWRETELLVRRKERRRNRILAGTACLLVLAGAFAWKRGATSGPAIGTQASDFSIVLLPAHHTLPDGSVVELKSGASVRLAFSNSLRRVILIRGEAHFQVVKDPRPFIVAANGVDVRAVGTAFTVELKPKLVEVMVIEGRVAVDQANSPQPVPHSLAPGPQTLALVDAGNRVVVDVSSNVARLIAGTSRIIPVSDSELNARLAWRVPKMELSGTPLSDVLPEINKFSGAHVSLADQALGAVRLSGVLRADNVDAVIQLLNSNYGIVVLSRTDREIVLGKR